MSTYSQPSQTRQKSGRPVDINTLLKTLFIFLGDETSQEHETGDDSVLVPTEETRDPLSVEIRTNLCGITHPVEYCVQSDRRRPRNDSKRVRRT